MKWRKLGKIFDPLDHRLPNQCVEFAQSPQTLVFDDFVRVYFSTRQRDPVNGKYLSHVAYVDMKKHSWDIISVSDHTVIPLGNLGCFDEHGIFPMNVLRHHDKIFGYTCGWNRRVSVSVDTSIGLAFSTDNGRTFKKSGEGPIVTCSQHEPFLVGDAFVRFYHDTFHMWYIFGTSWKKFFADGPPDRIYKIGHAVSSNGIDWTKQEGQQIVADTLGLDESQALPTVIGHAGSYHMFFCFRQSSDFRSNRYRGYRIGYAHSGDLQRWTRADEAAGIDVSAGCWDSDMQCYPHVFHCDERVYMLYNGNEFGRRGFGVAVLE